MENEIMDELERMFGPFPLVPSQPDPVPPQSVLLPPPIATATSNLSAPSRTLALAQPASAKKASRRRSRKVDSAQPSSTAGTSSRSKFPSSRRAPRKRPAPTRSPIASASSMTKMPKTTSGTQTGCEGLTEIATPMPTLATVLDTNEFVTCEEALKLLIDLYNTDLVSLVTAHSENLKTLKIRLHRSALSKIFKSFFSNYNPTAHISFDSLSSIALSIFSQLGFYANAPQNYVYFL